MTMIKVKNANLLKSVHILDRLRISEPALRADRLKNIPNRDVAKRYETIYSRPRTVVGQRSYRPYPSSVLAKKKKNKTKRTGVGFKSFTK